MTCDDGETDLPYDEVDWDTNFRKHPEQYRIGRGQFGVLKAEPYKSEILPHWSYEDEMAASESAETILSLFYDYLDERDFVGADMAKKFLHMGFTRSMRYAKYPGGKKYDDDGNTRQAHGPDTTGEWASISKREAAKTFKQAWDKAREDARYKRLKQLHKSGDLYHQETLGAFEELSV